MTLQQRKRKIMAGGMDKGRNCLWGLLEVSPAHKNLIVHIHEQIRGRPDIRRRCNAGQLGIAK